MRRRAVVVAMPMLLLAGVASASAWTSPVKQSNAGDSIAQGFGADGLPFDRPSLGFAQGTDARVGSLFSRYFALSAGFVQEPESVSGAEMVGGNDNFPAQASRICAQARKPTRVNVLLGGNDVCNRPRSSSADAAANMYSLDTWTAALDAGLDQLAACLPSGSVVQVLSAPRVDYLYEAGRGKSFWCTYGIWPMAGICRIVTAEGSASRRAQIGARIDQYNAALAARIRAYESNANGRNPSGVHFVTDWEGSIASGRRNTSVGTYRFGSGDINGVDCFHPNIGGQKKVACVAWAKGPEGSGDVSSCF
jgi:lysophospholipase L1-like esterase